MIIVFSPTLPNWGAFFVQYMIHNIVKLLFAFIIMYSIMMTSFLYVFATQIVTASNHARTIDEQISNIMHNYKETDLIANRYQLFQPNTLKYYKTLLNYYLI